MLFLSLIFIICGLISTIYGISYSNSDASQFNNGLASYGIVSRDNTGSFFIIAGIISVVIGIIIFVVYNNKKKIIPENNIDSEPINEIKNQIFDNPSITEQNNTVPDSENKVSELDKIYSLFKEGMYTEEEYIDRKERWIESLKSMNFNQRKNEYDILNSIKPYVQNNIIQENEFDKIKYIVTGKYAEDKYKKEQEHQRMLEEEARKKREELINNVKVKTKEISSITIDKINDVIKNNPIMEKKNNAYRVCECGHKIEYYYDFCPNCGKKINR